MTHDEAFAALRERKRAEETERDRGRVTWRRVAKDTSSGFPRGGWSGIGSGGRLVYVRLAPWADRGTYEIGRVLDGKRVRALNGYVRGTAADAKTRAAALLLEG